MPYFLGVDVGGTKTHALVADSTGQVLGFGQAGAGNPQNVGYDGLYAVLHQSVTQALEQAEIQITDLAGAGLGLAGHDWPSDLPPKIEVLQRLGLACPYRIVNDAVPGLVIGAHDGWGISVVAGTGCNCRGWNRERTREGRVTGYGYMMGENAGSSELMQRAMQTVNFAWIRRGGPTALTQALIDHVGASGEEDLIEGYTTGKYAIGAESAAVVFKVAAAGDRLAQDLVEWAGQELGEMVKAVARQLDFQALAFDVVLVGGMFAGGGGLIASLEQTVFAFAPRARLVRLTAPPVLGAVLIGLEQAGLRPTDATRARLIETA